jgi:aminotransferase EvaB
MTSTQMTVPYSYLTQQFAEGTAIRNDIMEDISELASTGDFTLGSPVERFEKAICEKYNVRHCIGTSSGTSAESLAIQIMSPNKGRTIVTAPNSFVASASAIVLAGHTPKFIDVGDDYQIDLDQASHRRVLAVPVHLTGLAKYYDNWEYTINDSAQAIGALVTTSTGEVLNTCQLPSISCFSLHPLKNLNVWGDGGFITVKDDEDAYGLRLLRNHGMTDRDTIGRIGDNARLSSMQAIVAYHGLKEIDWINERRRENAKIYDEGLKDIPQIQTPIISLGSTPVYHTYVITTDRRDELMEYLSQSQIETKIHYPIPLHMQPAFKYLGYKHGDFPVTERQAERILTLPIHQYLTRDQIEYTIERIRQFPFREG